MLFTVWIRCLQQPFIDIFIIK